MIYLNNAATSFPKPPGVLAAVGGALSALPPSSLRSNAPGEDVQTALRKALGALFHIADWERIFFAASATDALNRVLAGLEVSSVQAGPENHNSVLRPLLNGVLRVDPEGPGPALHIVNHCSNVTGEIRDLEELRPTLRPGTLLMVDAAQSAGCLPIDVDGWGIDILVFTGHKSLLGPTGTGGYYVRRGIPLRPAQFGGTGRDSRVLKYAEGDWEYEVGTPDTVGLAGLKAGVEYVLEQGVEAISARERALTETLVEGLRSIPHVQLYLPEEAPQGPVVSFNVEGLQPADVGYILQNSYGITVRTGLHCAPLVHRLLGTDPAGTVRASLGAFNTAADVDALLGAVRQIAASL